MVTLIAKKIGMTTVLDNNKGQFVPCTVVATTPAHVIQVKTEAKDGYQAFQVGFWEKKEKHASRPLQGHFAKSGTPLCSHVVEFKEIPDIEGVVWKEGSTVAVDAILQEGDFIDVRGISKGKGFTGVMKRHGFSGVGGRTHGQQDCQRAPGSIGAGSTPSRVFKGMRMAGRSGGKSATIKNLQIIKVLPQDNLLVIKGSIPGPNKSYVFLCK